MKIDIITIFPEMFDGVLSLSIIKRAVEKDLVTIAVHDLRRWTTDKRRTVDDRPFGGGAGMVLMVEPIAEAIEEIRIKKTELRIKQKVILTSPRGKTWNQLTAKDFSKLDHLVIVCGHYEGVDERVLNFVDGEVSIGDFVLTGGEIPAMVVVDSVVRLLPGVLKKEGATDTETFTLKEDGKQLLEYPQYTQPRNYRGLTVPEIVFSGNHAEIEKWKIREAVKVTKKNRPDLLGSQN